MWDALAGLGGSQRAWRGGWGVGFRVLGAGSGGFGSLGCEKRLEFWGRSDSGALTQTWENQLEKNMQDEMDT